MKNDICIGIYTLYTSYLRHAFNVVIAIHCIKNRKNNLNVQKHFVTNMLSRNLARPINRSRNFKFAGPMRDRSDRSRQISWTGFISMFLETE